ncbi:MAG: hypothetical protein ACI9WV_001779 [Patiriisocius sp.]|jgi:hypothetical protein
MRSATGIVVSWLNADDKYFSWPLYKIDFFFSNFKQIKWIASVKGFLNSSGNLSHFYNNLSSRPIKYIQKGAFRKNIYGYLQ